MMSQNHAAPRVGVAIEEKVYQNERVVQESRVSRYSDLLRGTENTLRQWTFTLGSQERIDSSTTWENIEVFQKPASAIDWVKSLIIEWQPSLNFGWIIPKMVQVSLARDVHHRNTYYNVLPTPKQFDDREVMSYRRLTREEFPLYSEVDLLESEPPTRQEVQEQRIKARDMAAYLAAFGGRY